MKQYDDADERDNDDQGVVQSGSSRVVERVCNLSIKSSSAHFLVMLAMARQERQLALGSASHQAWTTIALRKTSASIEQCPPLKVKHLQRGDAPVRATAGSAGRPARRSDNHPCRHAQGRQDRLERRHPTAPLWSRGARGRDSFKYGIDIGAGVIDSVRCLTGLFASSRFDTRTRAAFRGLHGPPRHRHDQRHRTPRLSLALGWHSCHRWSVSVPEVEEVQELENPPSAAPRAFGSTGSAAQPTPHAGGAVMWEPDFTLLSVPARIPDAGGVGSWFPELPAATPREPCAAPPPCKRHKHEPRQRAVLPYAYRAVAVAQGARSRKPFRHAGLMRDIEEAGFMSCSAACVGFRRWLTKHNPMA